MPRPRAATQSGRGAGTCIGHRVSGIERDIGQIWDEANGPSGLPLLPESSSSHLLPSLEDNLVRSVAAAITHRLPERGAASVNLSEAGLMRDIGENGWTVRWHGVGPSAVDPSCLYKLGASFRSWRPEGDCPAGTLSLFAAECRNDC